MAAPIPSQGKRSLRIALVALLIFMAVLAAMVVAAWLGGDGQGGFVYEGFN